MNRTLVLERAALVIAFVAIWGTVRYVLDGSSDSVVK